MKLIRTESFRVLKANFILLLKVRYPFYDFYYQLLLIFLNSVKVRRMREFPAFEKKNEYQDYLKKYDFRFVLRFLTEEGTILLKKLSPLRAPSFGRPMIINWEGLQASLAVPDKLQARYVECRHSIPTVIKLVSWSNFVMILASIMLEKHIVFVHPDREIVAHLMYLYQYVFHKYYSSVFMAISDHLFLVS